MSRAKQYERAQLLERAIEVFHHKGFNATSTAELVEKLGINRKTMYAEFGSKEALFVAALHYYDQKDLRQMLAPLEAHDASLDNIKIMFKNLTEAHENGFSGLGCLLCNTAFEREIPGAGSKKCVELYFSRIRRAFTQILKNAQSQGLIHRPLDCEKASSFLTTLFIGVVTSIRAEVPPEQLWANYHIVCEWVDTL